MATATVELLDDWSDAWVEQGVVWHTRPFRVTLTTPDPDPDNPTPSDLPRLARVVARAIEGVALAGDRTLPWLTTIHGVAERNPDPSRMVLEGSFTIEVEAEGTGYTVPPAVPGGPVAPAIAVTGYSIAAPVVEDEPTSAGFGLQPFGLGPFGL